VGWIQDFVVSDPVQIHTGEDRGQRGCKYGSLGHVGTQTSLSDSRISGEQAAVIKPLLLRPQGVSDGQRRLRKLT
jgi:hypothetical protein